MVNNTKQFIELKPILTESYWFMELIVFPTINL